MMLRIGISLFIYFAVCAWVVYTILIPAEYKYYVIVSLAIVIGVYLIKKEPKE